MFPGPTVDDCLIAAQKYAGECGAVFIHPFDHPDVAAGQGTIGLEIMEQCPDVRTIVAPVGGGGLLSGIAAAAKGAVKETGGRDIKILGAQAKRAAAFPPSLAVTYPSRSSWSRPWRTGSPSAVPATSPTPCSPSWWTPS